MGFYLIGCALMLMLPLTGSAQHITDGKGKTYYDEDHTQLKEVYSYKQVTVLNPRTSESQKKKEVRHGPYFYYYQDGDIKVAGRFKDGERHGKWKHYHEDGTLQKLVTYQEGAEVKVNKKPQQPDEKSDRAKEQE